MLLRNESEACRAAYSENKPLRIFLRGGGVQALNFQKHYFEITVDPKVPSTGPTFWWVLIPETLQRQRGGHAHFLPKNEYFQKA